MRRDERCGPLPVTILVMVLFTVTACTTGGDGGASAERGAGSVVVTPPLPAVDPRWPRVPGDT